MSSKIQHIHSTEEFTSLINSGAKVIVDFHAQWCGPCKVIAPKYEVLAGENENVVFAKVDVDELTEVSEQAGIRAMPTFQIYHQGSKVEELLGANPAKLNQLVKTLTVL